LSGENLKYIYWFAYYNFDSPSVRYRAKYPLEYIKKNHYVGYSLVIPSYRPSYIFLFIRAYFSALLFRRKNSMIVIQRVNSHFVYSTLLKVLVFIRRKNTFYDLDDADYLEHPPSTIFYFVKKCSAVIVGSVELKNYLLSRNNLIYINTSPVPDAFVYKVNKSKIFTIGWIGTFGGGLRESLVKDFFPAVSELSFPCRFVILGVRNETDKLFILNYFSHHKNIELEIPLEINWKNELNIQHRIAEFDVGIATILDTELHRSKSAFKLKQYMNNGVPVLSSDLPENNRFIQRGFNGFLCRSQEEFKKYLNELNEMPSGKYSQLSVHARQSVKEFDLEYYAKNLKITFSARRTK